LYFSLKRDIITNGQQDKSGKTQKQQESSDNKVSKKYKGE